MGKNTFYSLPHLLKNRGHYVLSHDHKFSYQGVKVFHNYDDLLEQIKNSNEEFYVIGGASIYKLFINDVKDMLLTEIDDTCIDADTYFPYFNQNDWDKEIISKHTYNDIQYKHVKYLRR